MSDIIGAKCIDGKCCCEAGPYLGCQRIDSPPRCERCGGLVERDGAATARDIPALVKLVREMIQQVAEIAIPLEAMFIYGNETSLSPAMADGLRKARDIARSIALLEVPQEDKQ